MASRFGEKETADNERVSARTEITADSVARREHEWFAEQVEGSVEQDGRGRLRAETLQQIPERGIGLPRHDMEAHQIAGQRVHGKQVAVFGAEAPMVAMKCAGGVESKYFSASSSGTESAKGRKGSRCFR